MTPSGDNRRPTLSRVTTFIPWIVAACGALGAVWFSQRWYLSRSEAELLRQQHLLNELTVQAVSQELEAERIVSRRLIQEHPKHAPEPTAVPAGTAVTDFKIITLAPMVKPELHVIAVVVWDPQRQEGLLKVSKLPRLPPHQDYQLWMTGPEYPDSIDAGVFQVDPTTGAARLPFKPKRRVGSVNTFSVTQERKGGVRKPEGPCILLGKD